MLLPSVGGWSSSTINEISILTPHLVTGVVWFIQGTLFIYTPLKSGVSLPLLQAAGRWIPALAFSLGMDLITNGMIAGRLAYFHRSQRMKAASKRSISYLPVLVIFIESGILSTLSKVIQLLMDQYAFDAASSPVVIPLCVRSRYHRLFVRVQRSTTVYRPLLPT